MQALVRCLLLLAAFSFSVFASSSVIVRSGPGYAGIVKPEEDCRFNDKTIRAIRIEKAILNDDGDEIGRATVSACSKTESIEEYWFYTLDEDGHITDKRKDVIRLDARDRTIEIATHTWDEHGESIRRSQMTYDSAGRLLEDRTVESEGASYTFRQTYDERGDLILSAETGGNGDAVSITRFRYDNQHHVLARIADRAPNCYSKYDLQGRVVEEVTGEGENKTTIVYTYDEQGRPLSKRILVGPSDQIASVSGFSYWPNGFIKQEWRFRPPYPSWDPQGLTVESYAYDEHDHLTQEWNYSQRGEDVLKKFLIPVDGRLETFGTSNGLPSFTYTYDSHGNWIKAVETMLSDSSEPASKREVTDVFYRRIDYR